MSKSQQNRRDTAITHEIHRLFWQANNQTRRYYIICYLTRVPALIIYDVVIPLLIAFGIQAIFTDNFKAVNQYALMIVSAGLLYCVLWTIGGWYICKNGVAGLTHLQRSVFANYIAKDYEYYGNTFVGSLSAQAIQLRDSFNIYNQLAFLSVPRQFTTIIAGSLFIAFQSWLLAAVTLTCMVLVLSFTLASSRWRLRFRRTLSEANSELAGVTSDALGQGTTIKSFATEDFEKQRLDIALHRSGKAQFNSWASSIPADDGRMLLSAITTALILILTARLYQADAISLAIVALIQLYVIKMISSTQDIAETIKSYESAMGGAYKAVQAMLHERHVNDSPDVKRFPKDGRPEIQFNDVSYAYDPSAKSIQAISDFNLTIRHGERVGLIGYSGSGKTTLTKLLMRFMDVSAGTIAMDGIDIREVAQQELRKRISYVPQEPLLFHRTIAENIAYGRPGASRTAILKAAEAAYVDEFVKDLPNGYDTLVGERGVKLSGGQRQRVAIARALLKDAPILLLDEATSALDSRSEQYIQKALWKLMKGRTAIVIAHRLSTIQRMDRIVVMDKGRIVQVGSHDELLQDENGIYAQLWAHQSGGYIGVPSGDTKAIARK